MGPFEAIKLFYTRIFDYQGRSRRAEYWWVVLFNLVVLFGGIMLSAAADNEDMGVVFILIMMLNAIPMLSLIVRRFHDQNMSGWFMLLYFVPWLGSLIIMFFMLIDGTKGMNKFGPSPKDGAATSQSQQKKQDLIAAFEAKKKQQPTYKAPSSQIPASQKQAPKKKDDPMRRPKKLDEIVKTKKKSRWGGSTEVDPVTGIKIRK